ncbi:P-loop containing nucleoside triphosphate hydrolase protein [Crassisporium funariophilum]|nr:P-loop containing nucleoside triphosphate hydrolase protein [Crassisporium funariophilum]
MAFDRVSKSRFDAAADKALTTGVRGALVERAASSRICSTRAGSVSESDRLQIARALARPSPILILDECTSALDGENAAGVLETVWGAKGGRTTVMVTHKMEVMWGCDRLVVLDGGVVVDSGTWGEGGVDGEEGGVCDACERGTFVLYALDTHSSELYT